MDLKKTRKRNRKPCHIIEERNRKLEFCFVNHLMIMSLKEKEPEIQGNKRRKIMKIRVEYEKEKKGMKFKFAFDTGSNRLKMILKFVKELISIFK